ncbi:MAG: hypothetical protein KDA62_09500 [Planctomycetales bacterium]|nr:hypothetical protein [Planctomycetales bacterium]
MKRESLQIGVFLLVLASVRCSDAISAEQFTSAEVKFLSRMSASVRSGNKMLDAPEPDLVGLHEFSQNGPSDMRRVAEIELMGWAIAAANSQRATAAWKVADAEGKPELYLRWVKAGEQHLAEFHKNDFPFSVAGISQLRPGSGGFIEAAQRKRHVQLRLLAVSNELKKDRLLLLGSTLMDRAEQRKHRVMDPAKDLSLNAQIGTPEGTAMLARLQNRGRESITNAVVITIMQVNAPAPAIPPDGVMMLQLNSFAQELTGFESADNDLIEVNSLLDQWNWGQVQISMVFIPELKPREQLTLYVGETTSAQFAINVGLSMYCDQFYVLEMPITGLVAYQTKKVAEMKRRRATWMNGQTPVVVADKNYELDFEKARRNVGK